MRWTTFSFCCLLERSFPLTGYALVHVLPPVLFLPGFYSATLRSPILCSTQYHAQITTAWTRIHPSQNQYAFRFVSLSTPSVLPLHTAEDSFNEASLFHHSVLLLPLPPSKTTDYGGSRTDDVSASSLWANLVYMGMKLATR